ncbi:MAG TPA: SDR family oxidoreductase [Sporichthyaceae bacterium]|nr:SDR family oxidoreductase [Sporichthyaceae bacterium]
MERRTAVVTGGVSGIGKAITEGLRAQEFRVAVFDLDADAAAAAAGPDGLGVAVDVADARSVDAGVAAVHATLGPVQVLVNNAGIGGGPTAGRCHETPVEVWEHVQAVNTRGPFLCSRAVLPDMLAAGYGQIVTIASINGLVVLPGRCAYTTSKGGAVMFAKSLAVDYGRHGIRSNAICPGMVRTPLVAARIDAGAWDVESLIPLGRPGEPEEIAEAVCLLAAGRLDYMNGAAWVIDGGWTAL